jgi:hypothetical protein
VGGVQRGLLRRAVEQVRPGGSILYVTCTSAPEENEVVAAWALRRLPVSVERIDFDFPHDDGLGSVGGSALPAEVKQAWRLSDAHVDSGCLFMVRFRREPHPREPAVPRDQGWREPPASVHAPMEPQVAASLDHAMGWLRQEMGIPSQLIADLRWTARTGSVWMHSCQEWPVEAWEDLRDPHAASWNLLSLGIRAFRIEAGGWLRPTNDLFRWLDRAVVGRVVTLERDACLELLDAGQLAVESALDGYVALRLEDSVIGRGWVRGGRLKSEIPEGQAQLLTQGLRAAETARAVR